nr:TlpA family protein disulfide reductase [Saprospiraceae bacterium]
DEEIEVLDGLVSDFEQAHPALRMTKIMKDKVSRYRKVAIGSTIPALRQMDTTGTMIDIRDHLGKYTLIDFWASWCRPCILQVPDIKQAQKAYGDQGFGVFGVSFDSNGDKWKEAIEQYELDWPHVSDVRGWKSQQAKDFNVTFVPFNLLVDEKGVIVGKNLHSKALLGTLERLFATQG